MITAETILVLAPHTDDGELGCGAAIAELASAGKQVHYAAFSLCKKSLHEGSAPDTLEKECRMATAILGIKEEHLHFFDHEVREFGKNRQKILEEMVQLNKKINPGLVFIPSLQDMHQDHQVIHTEAQRAFKNSSQLGYELPWNHSEFKSTYFIKPAPASLDKKVKAIAAYVSQSHRNYMKEDFIRSLAKVRGVQCGGDLAEAFEVYKFID
jgi:LmbE family N-acetylglucosaminyl deacetylase